MKIGDIDVLKSIVQLESDVLVLQQALNYITRNNKGKGLIIPNKLEIETFKEEAAKKLQKKYPNMGITRTNKR